jgi:hypothetical protein
MPEPLKDRHCGTCIYRQEWDGTCHRFPPQTSLLQPERSFWQSNGPLEWRSEWPEVDVDDFCGEYKRS